MPVINVPLATDEVLRALSSRNAEEMYRFPWLYIHLSYLTQPAGPDDMKSWGVAKLPHLADYVRLYPDSFVAPRHLGDRVSRQELMDQGAASAIDVLTRELSRNGQRSVREKESGQSEDGPG